MKGANAAPDAKPECLGRLTRRHTMTMIDVAQMQGESTGEHVARLKGLGILAEDSIHNARELQEHCHAAYRRAIRNGAAREVVQECADAILRASSQMARAKKNRDDIEYALFEALQVWDGQ
jgi:hypothetical protein